MPHPNHGVKYSKDLSQARIVSLLVAASYGCERRGVVSCFSEGKWRSKQGGGRTIVCENTDSASGPPKALTQSEKTSFAKYCAFRRSTSRCLIAALCDVDVMKIAVLSPRA